ncbi:MAG: nitroreductase family protein [Lachnospiraceae bacterium]|nr:nitroreductase family protein [Lachnospiraceae bacterium]
MNETLRTIANRYSCRSFTGAPVENEKIEAIALAAVQSPSGMNVQPWQIVVIKDKTLIDDMDATTMDMLSKMDDKSLYERIAGRGGKIYYNTPCMFMIAKKEGTDLDCGIVAENIALAASSLGLGNVICGLARLTFDSEKGQEYAAKIIPEGYEFGMTVLVGYATNPEGTPHEPDMSKIKYIG